MFLRTYFNSHPHEEDDTDRDRATVIIKISTHILTKRMTVFLDTLQIFFFISTHILTKRMTIPHNRRAEMQYFNSHPHEEDDDIFYGDSADWDISTHILTKRMTGFFRYDLLRSTFQLTSSRRG